MQRPSPTFPVDGAAIRAIRMRHGIGIPQLADRVGVTASYLSRIEVGTRRRMRPDTYGRLRSALGLRPDDTRLLATRPTAPEPEERHHRDHLDRTG